MIPLDQHFDAPEHGDPFDVYAVVRRALLALTLSPSDVTPETRLAIATAVLARKRLVAADVATIVIETDPTMRAIAASLRGHR